MNDIFLRTRMLLGDDAMDRLASSHVAVFGLGGVGSYAVEALARSGIGELPAAAWTSTLPSGSIPSAKPTMPTTGRRFSPQNMTSSSTPSTWSPVSWT